MRLDLVAAIAAVGLYALVADAATVGSLESTTGTWRAYRGTDFTTLVCSASSEAAVLQCIAADTDRRAATTRYQIRYPNRYVTVTYSAPTPSAEIWTLCAQEGGRCAFTAQRRVRYGANATWVVSDFSDGVDCSNGAFGRDPLPDVPKRCELSSVVPMQSPTPTGTAALRWTPPTQNTDGSTLTNLAGYRISYGSSPTALTNTIQVANPGLSSYSVSNLAPGTYYFAVRAYTSGGTESSSSSVVSKVVM